MAGNWYQWCDWLICRVGQNHIYTVYVRHFWQKNRHIYGHIRRIYTVLANPTHLPGTVVGCQLLCLGSCLARGVVLQLFVPTYHRLLQHFDTSTTIAYLTHFVKSSGVNAKAKFHYMRVYVSAMWVPGVLECESKVSLYACVCECHVGTWCD